MDRRLNIIGVCNNRTITSSFAEGSVTSIKESMNNFMEDPHWGLPGETGKPTILVVFWGNHEPHEIVYVNKTAIG